MIHMLVPNLPYGQDHDFFSGEIGVLKRGLFVINHGATINDKSYMRHESS